MPPQNWGVMTHTEDRAFLHILDPDIPGTVRLPLESDVHLKNPRFFDSGDPLEWTHEEHYELQIPGEQRDAVDTIVVFDRPG